MNTKQQIDRDLKIALLGGDKQKATVLRGLKSSILNVEIEKNLRETGLPEDQVIAVLAKQSKQRQESADMYTKGDSPDRAQAELEEKVIIDRYLPGQMDDTQLQKIVDDTMQQWLGAGPQSMGQLIAEIKKRTAGQADGGRIAQMVKQKQQ